jgi:predicted DNA binding protein
MYEPSDEPYHITLEIENRRCKGLKMLKDLGVQQYTLNDIRSLPEGSTRHLLRMPSKMIAEIPKDTFTKIRGSNKLEGKTSAWFDSDGCDVCKTILSQNSFLLSGRHVDGHTIIYSFVAPSFEAFQNIMSTLEAGGFEPKPLEVTKFKPKGKILTEKQERVLWLALKMGFFAFPRKINMLDLSRRLGVGLSTLSEIIRRGTRRLLENHFET